MKILRNLFLLALVCGFTGFAKADSIDFRMNVLDPPFITYPINDLSPLSVIFTDCGGQLPTNVAAPTLGGCFSAVNRTGQSITGLNLAFNVGGSATGQTAGCDPYPFNSNSSDPNIFSLAQCGFSTDRTHFVLTFTDGAILNNEGFVITEVGADPATFPAGTVSFDTSPIPEPASLLLLSTGLVMVGFLTSRRRGLGDRNK
jgi:hypothetical protein